MKPPLTGRSLLLQFVNGKKIGHQPRKGLIVRNGRAVIGMDERDIVYEPARISHRG